MSLRYDPALVTDLPTTAVSPSVPPTADYTVAVARLPKQFDSSPSGGVATLFQTTQVGSTSVLAVTNPGFEDDALGGTAPFQTPIGWTGNGTISGGMVRDTTEAHSGLASARIYQPANVGGNGYGTISDPISALPSTTYTASVWIKADPAQSPTGDQILGIYLTAGPYYSPTIAYRQVRATTQWQQFSITGTTPSTTSAVRFWVINDVMQWGPRTWWMDDVVIEGKPPADDDLRIGVHKRAGSVAGYQRGWKLLPPEQLLMAQRADNNVPAECHGLLAPQRQGKYVYGLAILNYFRSNEKQVLFRFSSDQSIEVRHSATKPLDVIDWGSNADMFVSDHDPPRLWIMSLDRVSYLVDDGTLSPEAWEASYKDFFQWYDRNADTTGMPALVHPWSAGDMGNPELWWFIPERSTQGYTGMVRIERRTWAAGNYLANHGYGGGVWPGGGANPTGLAFSHASGSFVGQIGPFPGLDPADVGGGPVGMVTFRVHRDPKRPGRLWLIAIDSLSGGRLWTATSRDDGRRWSKPRPPLALGFERGGLDVTMYQNQSPHPGLTSAGYVLMPTGGSTLNGSPRQVLVAVNATEARATSTADAGPVVFNRYGTTPVPAAKVAR